MNNIFSNLQKSLDDVKGSVDYIFERYSSYYLYLFMLLKSDGDEGGNNNEEEDYDEEVPFLHYESTAGQSKISALLSPFKRQTAASQGTVRNM